MAADRQIPRRDALCRRNKGLADALKDLQRFGPRGMGRKARVIGVVDQAGVGLGHKAQGAGQCDVGMANLVAKPPGAGRAFCLEQAEHRRDLNPAAVFPSGACHLVQAAFVKQADRLISQTAGQRGNP